MKKILMTNNKPDIDTMKAELEAAGYVFDSELSPSSESTADTITNFDSTGTYISFFYSCGSTYDMENKGIPLAYAHMQQQRELARYRELGKQACDIPIGASIDQERIIDRMDAVYKLITLPNITANDDESDDTT